MQAAATCRGGNNYVDVLLYFVTCFYVTHTNIGPSFGVSGQNSMMIVNIGLFLLSSAQHRAWAGMQYYMFALETRDCV